MVLKSSALLQKIMRAVHITEFGGPEVCKVANISKPTPGQGQVLIKTKYAGINPVDTYKRSGAYAKLPELPFTPGSDCSGTIEAVGSGVDQFKVGDSVLTLRSMSGACAEYTTAAVGATFPLNTDRLTYEQGACLGVPYFTAYRALFNRAQARGGETILVHGASGGVGTMCVQIAKHLGLTVYATAGSEKGLDIVKESGADHVYNHKNPGYTQEIKGDTEMKGVNIIIEMLANVNLQQDLEMLAIHGRVIVVGSRGVTQINPRETMMKESSIMGCMLAFDTADDWKVAGDALADYQKQAWFNPVVSKVKQYTLDNVSEAHIDILSTTGASGNLVINTSS